MFSVPDLPLNLIIRLELLPKVAEMPDTSDSAPTGNRGVCGMIALLTRIVKENSLEIAALRASHSALEEEMCVMAEKHRVFHWEAQF